MVLGQILMVLGQILMILVKYRYVALFTQKSSARTKKIIPPAIDLGIKTFLETYMNNICQSKSSFATPQTS